MGCDSDETINGRGRRSGQGAPLRESSREAPPAVSQSSKGRPGVPRCLNIYGEGSTPRSVKIMLRR